jgi:hypothetical protein
MNSLTNKEWTCFTITELEVWAVSKKPYCINDLMALPPLTKNYRDFIA